MRIVTAGVVIAAVATLQLAGCIVVPPRGERPYGHGGGYRDDWDDAQYSEKIVCASKDGRPQLCRTPFRIRRAELDKRYSGSPCEWGRSWGSEDYAIWVTDGCRARFRLYPDRRR